MWGKAKNVGQPPIKTRHLVKGFLHPSCHHCPNWMMASHISGKPSQRTTSTSLTETLLYWWKLQQWILRGWFGEANCKWLSCRIRAYLFHNDSWRPSSKHFMNIKSSVTKAVGIKQLCNLPPHPSLINKNTNHRHNNIREEAWEKDGGNSWDFPSLSTKVMDIP